jgi:hypothetical protein
MPLSASRRARMLAVQKRQWDESCPHHLAAPSARARAYARRSSATRRSRREGEPIGTRSGPIGNPLHILLRDLQASVIRRGAIATQTRGPLPKRADKGPASDTVGRLLP